jgi:hypothetical protein
MVVAALVRACSDEGSSTPRSLNPDEAAFEPRDVIGVVADSDMRHSAVGPVFQRGTLSLADGRSVEITDTTVRVDGCDGADRQLDPTAAVVAYDYADCLAFLDLDEKGGVVDAMMLAPLEGRATDDRWSVTGDPVGIESGILVLRPRPTGDERFFSLDDDAEPDLTAAVAGHTGSCAEGVELDAMSFHVNAAGEITGFAGYGAPVDSGFADDPCASVI